MENFDFNSLSDAYGLVQQRLVPLFADVMGNMEQVDGNCHFLDVPTNCYVSVDSYKQRSLQSDVAQAFGASSLNVLGVKMGTYENPKQIMRLMDYKMATMIIPTDTQERIELWVGGKYVEMASPVSPIHVRALSGNAALPHLLESKIDGVVINITPRRELWIKNIAMSKGNHLAIADQEGLLRIDKTNWLEFKKKYLELDKKMKKELPTILRLLNSGALKQDSVRVQKVFQADINTIRGINELLPKEPFARQFYLNALGGVSDV